jgi:hypothetical protein
VAGDSRSQWRHIDLNAVLFARSGGRKATFFRTTFAPIASAASIQHVDPVGEICPGFHRGPG